jgi:hypothetical protein
VGHRSDEVAPSGSGALLGQEKPRQLIPILIKKVKNSAAQPELQYYVRHEVTHERTNFDGFPAVSVFSECLAASL